MRKNAEHPVRLVRWLLRVCTALGVLLVVVMTTPLVYVWAHHLSGPLSPKDGKTLIVLGAAYDDEEGTWRIRRIGGRITR